MPREVRALLGAFSLECAGAGDRSAGGIRMRRACSQVVDELERNGHNLQHFSRELARYFRNLLVAKIAGGDTRLIAASPAERREPGARSRRRSPKRILTRYLQLSLDLFRDLQASLQPRFHLEIGLLQAGAGGAADVDRGSAGGGGAGGEGRRRRRATPAPTANRQIRSRPAAPPRPSPFEAGPREEGGAAGAAIDGRERAGSRAAPRRRRSRRDRLARATARGVDRDSA